MKANSTTITLMTSATLLLITAANQVIAGTNKSNSIRCVGNADPVWCTIEVGGKVEGGAGTTEAKVGIEGGGKYSTVWQFVQKACNNGGDMCGTINLPNDPDAVKNGKGGCSTINYHAPGPCAALYPDLTPCGPAPAIPLTQSE